MMLGISEEFLFFWVKGFFSVNLFKGYWTLNIVAEHIGKECADGDRFSYNVRWSLTVSAILFIASGPGMGPIAEKTQDASVIMFMYLRQKAITAFSFLHKNIWQMVVRDF